LRFSVDLMSLLALGWAETAESPCKSADLWCKLARVPHNCQRMIDKLSCYEATNSLKIALSLPSSSRTFTSNHSKSSKLPQILGETMRSLICSILQTSILTSNLICVFECCSVVMIN
jgi:hypothetical protein